MSTSRFPQRSVQGGKEEVRVAVVKPYLLRLQAEKGKPIAQAALLNGGVDPTSLEDETVWISESRARRALRSIAKELGGEASLASRGAWARHPDALGSLVQLIRLAQSPIDAYRYTAEHSAEMTRVGSWEIEESEKTITMRYMRNADTPSDRDPKESEQFLCPARAGELKSFPTLWGLPEATMVHSACICRGDDSCVYEVTLPVVKRMKLRWPAAVAVALLSFLIVVIAGGWLAAALAAVFGAALGATIGTLRDRSNAEESKRAFEQVRIAALERSLALRGGESRVQGDITGTLLGGKYRIGRKIGSGGMGIVYAAEHATLGHEVAVKVLRGAAARDGSEIARLRREAHIQVHVDHPNIARVLDLDQMPDGSIYVVMERLVGRSLADRLNREGILAPGFAIPCFAGVCRALAAAHSQGVVHRDLKPGNIFLCEDGTSKVLDFGMSKLPSAESLTQAGYTLGTPEYMAPEQCIGATVEARTDLYALGVVMYEALTGDLPINAANRRDLLDLHQKQIPKPMRVRFPDLPIPPALDDAVMACLRKRIADRPSDASALERALSAIPLTNLPSRYPPGTAYRRRKQGDARTLGGVAPPRR